MNKYTLTFFVKFSDFFFLILAGFFFHQKDRVSQLNSFWYIVYFHKSRISKSFTLTYLKIFLQKSKYPSPFLLDLGWPYMPYFNLDYTCITVMCFFLKRDMSARELILGLEIICPN